MPPIKSSYTAQHSSMCGDYCDDITFTLTVISSILILIVIVLVIIIY